MQCLCMSFKMGVSAETLATKLALEWLFSSMRSFMIQMIFLGEKLFFTESATANIFQDLK